MAEITIKPLEGIILKEGKMGPAVLARSIRSDLQQGKISAQEMDVIGIQIMEGKYHLTIPDGNGTVTGTCTVEPQFRDDLSRALDVQFGGSTRNAIDAARKMLPTVGSNLKTTSEHDVIAPTCSKLKAEGKAR